MKTKLRKLLALLMTLAMFISSVPTTALAAVVPYPGGTDTGSGISLRSIVKPPVATTTYVFMNGTEEFARQILKNGQTLNNPGTPDAGSANKEFTGWRDGDNNAPTFGAVTVTETKTITYHAQFADVYFVFFTNEKGEVMVTKKGANGDTISTEGVTYPVGNEQSIVGWKDASGNLVSSVTLNGSDVTLTARVENGHWITYDSQGGTYVAPTFVKGNGTTTAPAAPTRPGYTFHHWSATVGGAAFTFGNALTTALTLYAVWTPNTRTQYTVIHWQENADDDEYSYAESETKYGTTGAQTSAAAKSYTGFTAQTIAQQTIAGDGSTIVNVYYKRNVYEVKFFEEKSGQFPWSPSTWEENTSLRITAKHGANIRAKWPIGTFWYVSQNNQDTAQSNLDTMPIGGKNFYGKASGNGKAYYYVEVLPGESGTETVGGKTYKLDHTDTGYTNGTVTDEERYEMTGFTCNVQYSAKNGDRYPGSKFYYDRNSYNVVYINSGSQAKATPYLYQQSIADAGNYELTDADAPAGKEGYVFAGWYDAPEGGNEFIFTGKTMPAQNVTVYAHWAEPTVIGKAYITIDGTGNVTTLENVTYGGTITDQLNDLQATIMEEKPGYTWRGWRTGPNGTGEPFNVDTKIYSDITLYPYYTKDGTFTVKYVTQKDDVSAPVDGKSYAEDSFADLMSPGKLVAADGEYFLGWSDGAATYQPRDKYQIKSNHADEQNVITLTAQWGARPATVSLTYKANGGVEADQTIDSIANNDTVTTIENPFTRAGYKFAGWSTKSDDEAGSNSIIGEKTPVQVDSEGDNILYAIWTANTDTKYTVEFYYQNVDGTYTLDHSDKRTATTDTTVSVTADDKAAKENNKYVFEADNENNVLSGVVAGNGSLVLKLYFKLNTASYTIHHYLNGTTVKVAEDQTGTKTIGETLTANKSDALYPAYAAADVASYAPSQTITIAADESENVITVYYTMPLTITAEDANKTYDGQPLTQPDFTVEGLVNGDTKENFSLSMTAASTITNAGKTPNVIDTDTVKYNGDKIPSYYNVSYEPGTLTVNKASATVTITGVNETHVYDGRQHEANGYNYSFTGKPNEITISLKPNVLAIAKRTDVGTTTMGLTKDSFTVTSANYDVTINEVIDGYVTITPVTDKVTVTVTENGAIVTYDGNEHSVKGYKSMTADNALYDVTKSVKATETAAWTAKGTNAGEYPVGVAAGDFENINKNFTNVAFKIVDGVLKINPITENTITITANSASKTYDGTPLTNNGFTFTQGVLAEGDVLTAVVEGSATNVGDEGKNVVKSYKVMRGDVDVTGNYTFGNSIDGKLTINKREVTLTSASDSKTYDGKPLTNGNVTIGGSGFADGEGATFNVTGTITNVGKMPNDFTYTLNEGTNANNYTITPTAGELEVTPVTDEVVVTISGGTDTVTYDGNEHSVNGYEIDSIQIDGKDSTLYTVNDFEFTGTAKATGTNADKYEMGLKESDFQNTSKNFTNVKFIVNDGSLTINKRTVTLTSETASKEYDGTPLTKPVVTVSGDGFVDGEVTDVKATGSVTFVHEGEVTNAITYTEGANFKETNYTISKEEGKLSITKREGEGKTITVTANSDKKVYDGAPLTNNGFTHAGALVEGDVLTAVVEGSQTDVGSSDNVVTSYRVMRGETDVTTSYTFTESGKGALTVTARGVTFTGESKSLPYTGGMQSITGITQSGLVEGHRYEGLTYKAEGQNVGSYDGAFRGDVVIKDTQGNDVTKNYNVTETPGKLTIINASFAVTFTGESAEKVYNGEEQSITGITVDDGLKPGHRYEGLTYEAKGTDKGEYVGAFTGTVKILDENNVDVTENYAITQTPGTLTITAYTTEVVVTISGGTDTVTYDGSEHSVNGYEIDSIQIDGKDSTLYTVNDFEFTGTAKATGTNADKYEMGLKESDFQNTSKNFTNVKFIVNDGWLVISKRLVKVTAERLEYAYDYENPAAHPADGVARYTVEAANGDRGLLTGDALNADVLYDGQSTQTLIGVYQAVAQIAAAKITNANGDVTANYTIEKVDSTLTIKGNDPIDPGKETTSVQTNYTVGDVIEYKITVKNVSRDEATNVVVTDSMAEIQDSAGYTVSEDRHTATIASIPAGGTVLVYARHTVTAEDVENAYAGDASGSLTNVANIKFGDWNKDVEGDHDELNDTYEYVVRYYWNNYTSVQPHEEKKLTARVGTEVTEKPAAIEGYTPVSADSRKLTISADQSKNVIEFYYYKNVELTANSETYTYDGAEKQVNGFTIKGENKDKDDQTIAADFSAITVSAKGVDAGEYPANFAENTVGAVDETGRYIVTAANNGKLVINPVTGQLITITANSASKIYDGTPLTDNGFTFTQGVLADGDELTAVVEGSATNVGDEGRNVVKSYAVKRGETDVTKNYTFGNSNDGKLTINKRTVTLKSETASKEYDGTPLTKPDVTVGGDGFVDGEVTDVKATGSVTFVHEGEVTNAITYTEGANFKETNYTISKEEGKLSITKREGEGKTITVTANSDKKVYDGAPLTNNGFTHAGALVEGDVLTAVVEGSQTDVGSSDNVVTSYKVMRGETDVTTSYTFGESIIGKLTVTPVAIELTAASASKAYDGTPLTNSDYTITNGKFVDGEGLATVTIVGSQTLVGASANTITGHTLKDNTLAQNYTITYQPGELKVTQNEKAITITANSHTWEYDGQPHTDGGYTVNYDGVDYPVAAGEFATLPTGDKVTATVEGSVTNVADSADDNNVVTNVTITNEAGAVVNDQYKTITRVNGGLKITRRGDSEDEDKKVRIIAKSNTVGYDGKAHGAKLNAKGEIELGTSYTTARLVDGHYVDETTLDITGSQTNVGVYAEELKPAVKAGATRIVIRDKDGNDVTDNYALTLVNATLTITGDKLIPDKKAEDENIESNYKLGDEIEFTITVKNVSIYDVENVIVTDASAEIQAGDGYTVSADKHTATIAIIAAKSEIRIKALHTVTSEDILAGKVGNVANVEWKDGEKTVTKTVDDDTTKLTPPDVTLNVTKTSDWEGSNDKKVPPEVGTKITYTITVTNTGNVPATNVRFKDVLQENKATVTGDIPTYGTLGVGEENKESFTVEYIVTEADLLKGSILNEVFANADEINYTYYVEEDGKEVAKPGTKTVKEAEAFVEDTTVQASASFTSTKTTTSTPKNEKGYALGETITYEIKVTNDGNLTLTDVEVTEKLAGAVIKASSDYTVSGSVATIAELKPGQTVIVNVEYVVTEADILAGFVKNVATVKGNGPDDKDPDPKDPGTDDPTDKPKATLDIAKSVVSTPKNGTSYKLGETITYKLTVKVGADNNLTVKNIKVTDTLLTAENVNAKIVEIAGGYTLNENNEIELPDMAPGATEVVITYTYTVQESDLGSGAYGSVYNAATTKGITPDGQEPKKDTETNTPTNIRLIITAKPNTGIEYDGDAHGENGYDATGLATGHEITSVTISGSRTNVGYYPEELDPSDAVIMEGNVDVTSHYEITYVKGDLEIIKRGLDEKNPVQIIAKSNTVGYDGKAHGAKLNAKGEIELGTSYTTARLVDGHYVDETTLDITGSQTNVGVYAEELKPAVKAGATRIVIRDKDGNDVTDNYALTLVNATLTITGDKLIPDKKAEDENIESNYKLGDEIEFTITVKNVSIYDVENVIVTDASAEIQAGDGYTVSADKHTATIAIIAAKSEIRIKALHTVTSEDILAGKVGNVANVEWKDGEKTVTKTVDDDTTKLTPPDVTLNVTKTSDWEGSNDKKVPPEVGTKITYTITVTNTGNVPATNVRFKDVLQENKATVTGDIPTYGTLGVGEENKESFTVEYIVTEADLLKGSILNEVFANADEINYTYYVEEDGKEVAKPGTKTVKEAEAFVEDTTVQASASFTSTKTTTSTPKNEKGYALGETITYEIKVTNDGNLTLTDVEVTEKLAGAVIKASSDYTVSGSVATIAELKPGQTVIVNVEYVVTEADILAGFVKNVATVKGNGPDDKDPDPKDPGTDDPTDKPKATLDIAKSVVSTPKNGTSYKLGEKITYTLTVKVGADNNVTVKNIRVTDTLLTAENVNAKIVEIAGGYTLNATGEIELPDMAPGAADVVITYTYTVQESDLGSGAYGSVHNAAVSKGATPDPDPENPNPKPVNPKDEDKKDIPTNIRLVITANNNTGIVYDGEEHGEDGYKQTGLSKDHTIEKVTISGKRTNVGEEKLVPSDAKIVDKAGNDVTSHYDIEYVNATLEIIQKKLTITADSDEKFYDETPLTKDSYTNTELAKGDKIANVTITGTITEVGSVENVASGAKIVNAAEEDVTGNYDIEYVKGTLTIKAIPSDGFVDVTITKKWDDANNQDGKRDDVTLTLNASANGRLIDWDVLKDIAKNGANLTMDETAEHVFARAEFTDDKDSYSYTFRNVPKYANFNDVNTLIDFAVTENEVPDFYEIDAENSTRLMIVNVHEVKTMNIHVTKVWDDEDNNDGYRPDAITVKLYADGEFYGEKTITPDENDVWETTFENLPVYKKGETISYTVEEDAIDEYTTTYSTEKPIVGGDYDEAAREVTITNRYEIKKMNIKVIKIWADSDNEDKLRPNALSFDLYKTVGGGERELVLQFQLRSSTGTSVWKYKDLRTTIGGLNVYENGEKIHYSIEETTVIEGYTVKYIDNDIVGGNKVNDQYQTDFMTWVTNYHIIKRPNRLIGPMGMTSGECVE